MTIHQRAARLAAVVLIASLLAACGAPSTPPVEGSTGGAANASPSDGIPAPSGAVPVPSGPVVDLTDLAGSMAAAELAVRADDRERAGLANLGPGAEELVAAMDEQVVRAIARLEAEAGAGILAGHVAALGALAPEPGSASFGIWFYMVSSLDDFARQPQSGTVDMDPETVEIGGNTGTINTSMTLTSATSGNQLSVDITRTTRGQVVDRATGATIYSVDSIATGHVDVTFCPDASGQAPANVKLTSSEIFVQGGGSPRGISREWSGNVVITVGNDANIQRVEGTGQASEDSRGGVPPAGSSESDLPVSTSQASDTIANDGSGRRLPGAPRAPTFSGEGSTLEAQAQLGASISLFVELMVTAAAQEAEKLWKEGKCVEVLVDPETRDVEPDEVLTVTAKLRHKIDRNELDKPIKATLTGGVKTIDPSEVDQPAPATVTFTAGSEEGEFGRVLFKSVSNRGIAEKTVTYTVRPATWGVTFTGTDTEVLGPVTNAFKARITDFKITATDGVLSGTGKLHLDGKVNSGPCTGTLDQAATLTVTGMLVGTGPEAVLRMSLRAASPPGDVTRMRCRPSGGADIAAEGYAERFGEPLKTFDLPAAGGSVRVSKTTAVGGILQVTVKGTFKVTKGE